LQTRLEEVTRRLQEKDLELTAREIRHGQEVEGLKRLAEEEQMKVIADIKLERASIQGERERVEGR
jgi:hypothetical protein